MDVQSCWTLLLLCPFPLDPPSPTLPNIFMDDPLEKHVWLSLDTIYKHVIRIKDMRGTCFSLLRFWQNSAEENGGNVDFHALIREYKVIVECQGQSFHF